MSKPSDPNTIPEPRHHALLKNAPELNADAPVQSPTAAGSTRAA
jgi:hypothetical protein